jgi:pimeloyl-ACP methyl ester carboxylesterase
MKKPLLLFITFLGVAHFSLAQNIQRKGSLGVGFYQKVPDSLQHLLANGAKGALIQFVVPQTTAEKLGVQKDDIITQVNQTRIEAPNDLLPLARKLRGGEAITITLLRGGEPQTLTGKVVERPKETSPTAEVTYGEFKYQQGYVRTIYKSPKGQKPLATIYFLQGLPCYSLDNMQELDKTKQAIDALVERGFAVYRMEKGDMGDNQNTPDCASMGFHEELAMYDAGYQNLLTLPNLNSESIFLFGHSMGGNTAPLLAAKYQPKGIVIYGSLFKPWHEYLMDAYLIQHQYRGWDLGELRENLEKFKPYLSDFFYTNKTLAEITKEPLGMMAMQHLLSYNPQNQTGASGRHIKTFRELNEHNLAKAWGDFENYSLAIYGECDIAANNALDNIELINYLNRKRPNHGTFWLAPKSSHNFEEIGTMEEFVKWQNTPQAFYQFAAQRFNPKIFDYVAEWINNTLPKAKNQKQVYTYRDATNQLPEWGAKNPSMDVKAVDIDQDKDLDIVLANEFKPNTILLNDGKGNFTDASGQRLPQVTHDSEDVVTEDLDGDGHLDLLFCSEDDKVHEFYLNDGKGFFKESAFKFPNSEANAVIAGDVNQDGRQDVLFGNNGQNTVFINGGKGFFKDETATRLPQSNKVTQDLALLDIDRDGDLDLFEANEDGNALYQNDGKGHFKDLSANLPTGADLETRKVAFANIDRDGDLDLFLANVNFRGTKNPQNRLYLNNGKGVFADVTAKQLPTDTDHTIDAIFEDVNRDGAPDLVIANVFGGAIKIYLNNGRGFFADETKQVMGKEYVRDSLGVIACDLNNDGLRDLYFCDRYNPAVDKKDLLLIRGN